MGQHTLALKALCWKLGLPYVGTRGPVGAPVCVAGEAPGADEEDSGMPFVGFSGQEQDAMLAEAGFNSNDIWFTNPYKVRPPDNDLDRLWGRGIPEDFYLKQFWEELEESKPTIIVPVGATPLGILCPQTLERIKPTKRNPNPRPEAKISKWKGSLLVSPRLNWPHYVIPNWHPAFILREWSERQIAVLAYARAREEFDFYKQNGRLQPLPERELIVEPSADTLIGYLRFLLAEHKGYISSDIEMIRSRTKDKKQPSWAQSKKMPYCISLAESPWRGISFSFWHYPVEKLLIIWRLLDKLLRTRRQIGQNYRGFDCTWMEFLGFRPDVSKVSDTLVRHHVLWPEFEHKLQFQTFQYTREPYYKDEGREWKAGQNVKPLMVYNAKDSTVTYEVHDRQDEEFQDRPHLISFCNDYEERLTAAFHHVEKRGVFTHKERLEELRTYVLTELDKECQNIQAIVGKPVVFSEDDAKDIGLRTGSKKLVDYFNIGSPTQIKNACDDLNLEIPYDRHSGGYSTGEDNLNTMYAETSHPFLASVLRTRELNKTRTADIEIELPDSTSYSSYLTTGTLTGRRASRKTVFGFGRNMQNLSHHSDLGKRIRECYVARPGKIFVKCDQASAEDWIVWGIIADVSGDMSGINDLRSGVDRHQRLGSQLFGIPLAECGKDEYGNDTPYRFFGKKTRHAGQYDMGGDEMARQMAKENHVVPPEVCWRFLETFHSEEPAIKNIYHQWVQSELIRCRTLITPLGRERIFFGLHPWRDNSRVFKGGYAWIPQSTIGDNTGFAILWLEDNSPGLVIMDEHDGIVLEVDDNIKEIQRTAKLLEKAFDRILKFKNGLEIKVPIDVAIGYDLIHLKKVNSDCLGIYPNPGLERIVNGLKSLPRVPPNTTSGQPRPSSGLVLKGVSM